MRRLGLITTVLAFATSFLYIGCGGNSSPNALVNAAKTKLIDQGEILKLYHINSVNSVKEIAPGTYRMSFPNNGGPQTLDVQIRKVEYYEIYDNPAFYKYISLGAFQDLAQKGWLKAIGSVTLRLGMTTDQQITAVLMKADEKSNLEWKFVLEPFSPYPHLLDVIRSAYDNVSGEDFLKLVGKPAGVSDVSVKEVVSNPDRYTATKIRVTGIVKHTGLGLDFVLLDESYAGKDMSNIGFMARMPVAGAANANFNDGQRVTVTGRYFKSKQYGWYTFNDFLVVDPSDGGTVKVAN